MKDGNKDLLLFTLGPIQSYIQTARKTQDLYMGSFMLSYLIFHSINLLLKYIPLEDVIFPAVNKDVLKISSITSFPNRFLALVPKEKSEEIARHIEIQIHIESKNIAEYILAKHKIKQDLFKKQLPWTFWEVYWIITTPRKDESYKDFYERCEKSLGAVKNLRWFSQIEEYGKKCSLCGQREVVSIDDGDGLCSVCMVKRKASSYFESRFKNLWSFPSTAEIATSSFKQRVFSNETAIKLYEAYSDELKVILGRHLNYVSPVSKLSNISPKENFEGQWLYEESLDVDNIKRQTGLEVSVEELQKVAKCRDELIKHQKKEPSKYYAIITMDGDDIGKWLSGAMAKDSRKVTASMHHAISKALLHFNKRVRKIVEVEHLGRLIYAGGDDVFALMSLEGILDAALKLRKVFPHFESIIDSSYKSTASMGISIAYYKDPLNIAVSKARAMEQEAKNFSGKNAVAITYLTRSGEARVTVNSWTSIGNTIELVDLLSKYVSKSFTKDLIAEFIKMTTGNYIMQNTLQEAFKIGVKRQLVQSKNEDITQDEFNNVFPLLYKKIVVEVESANYDLKSFFNALEIIYMLGGE